jgi:hypothetical protein
MRQLPAVEFIDHGKGAPIVLAGEPRRLVGRVKLHNPAPDRVVLREARLHGAPPPHEAKRDEVRDYSIALTAILAPNQKSAVPVRVAIDAQTPPGDYAAELVLGEFRYPVQLMVAETVSLSVTPSEIVIENHPAERVEKRLFFTNDGNTPLQIGNIGAVVLDDELLACKTIRGTLEEGVDTPEKGADTAEKGAEEIRSLSEWISLYIAQGKRVIDSTGMLWVEVTGAPHTLRPGETRGIEVTIRIPDTLDPRSRYWGVIFLYDANIGITVAPTGAAKRKRRDK